MENKHTQEGQGNLVQRSRDGISSRARNPHSPKGSKRHDRADKNHNRETQLCRTGCVSDRRQEIRQTRHRGDEEKRKGQQVVVEDGAVLANFVRNDREKVLHVEDVADGAQDVGEGPKDAFGRDPWVGGGSEPRAEDHEAERDEHGNRELFLEEEPVADRGEDDGKILENCLGGHAHASQRFHRRPEHQHEEDGQGQPFLDDGHVEVGVVNPFELLRADDENKRREILEEEKSERIIKFVRIHDEFIEKNHGNRATRIDAEGDGGFRIESVFRCWLW